MCNLKRLLFGIILLSSFGSAFADEYDPKSDVFEQIINALVPILIVLLFRGSEEISDDVEDKVNKEFDEYFSDILSATLIDLCHIFSDICFLFYTRSIPVGSKAAKIFVDISAKYLIPIPFISSSYVKHGTPFWK
ncbi:hypothetical protein GLOIN_2v1471985 [Rhizophagus clarus]|uniref:Uncharacterized protein n=1 Tax=Rhizophagus clarus TaxID=94130 RepID=A0A8H3R0A2_9GLOM|nr:hypothetical protein GLOIN_2v1471985 [Rhizophagus clarus]